MYLATNIFPCDGVQTLFDFSFAGVDPESASGTVPYLSPADVYARELFVNALGNPDSVSRAVTIVAANRLRVEGAPIAAGRQVKIYRKTEIRFPLVDYRDRQVVSEADLDLANRQAIYVAQETLDAASKVNFLNEQDNWDMQNRRVVNVADGVDPTDAANLRQVEAALSHTLRTASTEPTVALLPPIATRKNKLLSFDETGAPVSVLATGSPELEIALRDSINPANGSGIIGHKGGTVASALNAVEDFGDASVPTKGAGKVGYKGRTVYARLQDQPSLNDYLSLAEAMADAGNRQVFDRNGVTYKDAFNVDLAVFTEATTPLWKGTHVNRQFSNGTHVGVARVAQSVELRPSGSGANGPSNADYAASFSNIKQNWFGTSQTGELDVLNITFRQGGRMTGGVASDAAGILINGGGVDNTGWYGAIEGQMSIFDPVTAAVTQQVQVGIGILDSVTDNYFGYTTTANEGVLDSAYFANQQGNGHWTNFLRFLGDGNVELFKVTESGHIVIRDGSSVTPSKTIRAINGSLSILNDAKNANILTLSDNGSMVVGASSQASVFAATGAAFSAGPSTIVYGGTTSPSANAGGASTLPATVQGYIVINVQGTPCRIPFYPA